jgi:SAM-dependent methyltransferase
MSEVGSPEVMLHVILPDVVAVLKEADELGINGKDTWRGIGGYTTELGFTTEQEFIDYITHRNVADVGSGLGGLAVEAALRGIDSHISSINPSIGREWFREWQLKQLTNTFGKQYTPEQIQAAIAVHDKSAYIALAHNIPLPDDSQDVVLDNTAITYYADNIGEVRYKKSLEEMLRIVKQGGKIRIGARGRYDGDDVMGVEKPLKELGLSYTPIMDKETGANLGVEIVKGKITLL